MRLFALLVPVLVLSFGSVACSGSDSDDDAEPHALVQSGLADEGHACSAENKCKPGLVCVARVEGGDVAIKGLPAPDCDPKKGECGTSSSSGGSSSGGSSSGGSSSGGSSSGGSSSGGSSGWSSSGTTSSSGWSSSSGGSSGWSSSSGGSSGWSSSSGGSSGVSSSSSSSGASAQVGVCISVH